MCEAGHCLQCCIAAPRRFAAPNAGKRRDCLRPAIDSYSAFRENDRKTPTGLTGYLRERGLTRVTLCGLATDFCVFFSAIDAREAGFETAVVLEASRAIDVDSSRARALVAMRDAGIELL